jgi:nanoRNase/pAp phosphatase (c-di-AMP/oligoRNAs hydrolase)
METEKIEDFADKFYNYLLMKKGEIDKIVLISHNNTDIDGLGSIFGLNFILSCLPFFSREDTIIYLPKINQISKKILNKLDLQYENYQNLTNDEISKGKLLIIVLDTFKFEEDLQKAIPEENISSIIIIDHHEKPNFLRSHEKSQVEENKIGTMENLKTKISSSFVEPSASSCAEIVGGIWREWEEEKLLKYDDFKKLEISPKTISQLLMLGIFSDSANLKFSKNYVVSIIDFLIHKGADIENLRVLRNVEPRKDEKIAVIKGAIRSEGLIFLDDYIVLFTQANSFESAICSSLIQLGADVAFCLSRQGKKKFRIIVRSSENFQINSDVNFGKFMEVLAGEFSGVGGGHKGAAGLTGVNPPANIKEILIKKLKKEINPDCL